MSAPAANASLPAPRSTTQRNPSSAESCCIARARSCHIVTVSGLSLPGLLSLTVAHAVALNEDPGLSVSHHQSSLNQGALFYNACSAVRGDRIHGCD